MNWFCAKFIWMKRLKNGGQYVGPHGTYGLAVPVGCCMLGLRRVVAVWVRGVLVGCMCRALDAEPFV